MPTPSGVGFAQDPAVTPGLGHAFVLVVVVVVRTGRPLPATCERVEFWLKPQFRSIGIAPGGAGVK